MNDKDYQWNLRQMREALIEAAKTYPLLKGLVYTSLFDFVAQHGIDYRPVKWQHQFPQGRQSHCYGNAIVRAGWSGLRYIEGVAAAPTGELIPHAWNATGEGELVDATWCNTGVVYLGVEFSVERADDAIWNADACVLNDEHRNYPVFQKRWTGEDFSIEWRPSDRLESLRANRPVIPPSIAEWTQAQKSGPHASQRTGGIQWPEK